MITLLRLLLQIPPPRVQRSQALSIAERICKERSFKISKPKIVEGLKVWIIWVNSELKGSPWIKIDNQNGEVIKISVIPR